MKILTVFRFSQAKIGVPFSFQSQDSASRSFSRIQSPPERFAVLTLLIIFRILVALFLIGYSEIVVKDCSMFSRKFAGSNRDSHL